MPGISGTDQALMYALAECRSGTARSGGVSARIVCLVDGVERRIAGLRINGRLGSGANTASFIARGWTPVGGEEIIITQGSVNRIKRMFGGVIIRPKTSHPVRIADHQEVSCSLVDWSWGLNADLVIGTFTGTFDEIALELMERYAPSGYTTRQVETGLPTVSNGIEFTDVYLSVALERLARRGGITQYVDYRKDLYFRLTPLASLTNPRTLTLTLKSLKAFAFDRDWSQVVTRVYFECKGSIALADIAALESIVPVNDASVYPTSGLVKSGTQRFAFAARALGGGGSLVGPGAAPSTAPTVVLAAGAGIEAGEHSWAFVFKTASGRTLPSPLATITVGFITAPTSAVVAGTPSTGAGLDGGTHCYYPVFRTAGGSTTAGPVSNSVTAIAQQAAPATGDLPTPTNHGSVGSGGLTDAKRYFWRLAYRRLSDGAMTTPTAYVQMVTDRSLGQARFVLTGVAATPSGYERVYYRTQGQDPFTYGTGDGDLFTYYEVTTGLVSGDSFYDQTTDAGLGAAAPSSNTTAKGVCAVTTIPVSVDPLVTHVDMYREFNNAGAGTAKLAFSVTNGTTSAMDTTANSGLGATVPSSNTAAASRASVTVPEGPSGTTDIEVFRTAVGSSQLKKSFAVGSNTAGTYTDSTADASLTTDAPTVDDSGLAQPDGIVLSGATSAPIASTTGFESSGWAIAGNGRVVFRFTGKTATSLTGIPASGPGSITASINYNSQITQAPQLTGITSGSPDAGSITYAIPKGQEINPVAVIDDTDAQAAYLDKFGGTGIRAIPLSNRSLSYAEAQARGRAYLDRRSLPIFTADVVTKDQNADAGRTQTIAMGTPTNISEEAQVQSVNITDFHDDPPVDPSTERHIDYMPTRRAQVSTELFNLEDVLRQDMVR